MWDGNSDTKIRRRISVGANVWRKVEGMMGDEHKMLTSRMA